MMKVDKRNLYRDVNFLSSIVPNRNFRNPDSLQRAADYIRSEFEKTGLVTSVQQWPANGITYENVIASYLPEKNVRFIIGAHYDAYYDSPGADDNASGVAAVLEIARLLVKQERLPDYGIDLVSFCLEEPPFFKKKEMGSYVHAKSVHAKNHEVLGMVSIEMVGYFSGGVIDQSGQLPEDVNTLAQPHFVVSGIRKFSGFNDRLSKLLRLANTIGVKNVSFADNDPNNGPSDHRNYWQFGYPGAMVIGGKKKGNPNYHKVSDVIETLDFDAMASAVEACAYAFFNW